MKKFNQRELTLALALGITLFLLGNLLFLPRLLSTIEAAKEQQTDLKAQLAAAENWIDRRDEWEARANWFATHQPLFTDRGLHSAEQLERIQNLTSELRISLDDIQLLNPAPAEFYYPVGARVKVSGTWKHVVEFLTEFQQPNAFDVITELSLRSDQDPANVVAEMQLELWFQDEA